MKAINTVLLMNTQHSKGKNFKIYGPCLWYSFSLVALFPFSYEDILCLNLHCEFDKLLA